MNEIDELIKPNFEYMAIDALRAELATVTAERDALRAKVDAVPVDAIAAVIEAAECNESAGRRHLEKLLDWRESLT